MSDLIGTKEAAEILGIDRSVLTRRVQLGRINYAHRVGTVYVFDRAAIIATAAAAAQNKKPTP